MSSADHILLTTNKLDVGVVSNIVSSESCGAISMFIGTTRDNFDNKRVTSLEYEAYEPMALKEMRAICSELRAHWTDVAKVAFHHRIGLVPVKEASVIIAVSSPHRQAAVAAVAFAVEELKKRVPIWKKEKYENDESEWKENKELTKQMFTKRPKLDFSTCEIQEQIVEPKRLVQITAEEAEIQRRIQCFIEKKREEIDINNIMDFTSLIQTPDVVGREYVKQEPSLTSSCARTNSIVVKQEHSKCHLKVRRVKNRIGPQTEPDYWNALDKLMSPSTIPIKIKSECCEKPQQLKKPSALEERLTALENHLHVHPKTKEHIYTRLKRIENRILYLESISPEYKHFMAYSTDLTVKLEQETWCIASCVNPQSYKTVAADSTCLMTARFGTLLPTLATE